MLCRLNTELRGHGQSSLGFVIQPMRGKQRNSILCLFNALSNELPSNIAEFISLTQHQSMERGVRLLRLLHHISVRGPALSSEERKKSLMPF